MSTISLTLTTTSLTATGAPLTLTASVTNAATVPARIVLAAFPPVATGSATPAAGAREWTVVERPLRELAPGATEQFTITVTPPETAPAGEHLVRFIAYDNDRPPEEYSDQARQLQIVVPAKPAPTPGGTPWWIWAAAGALVLVVGVVAFLVLRPQPEVDLPSPPPSSPTAVVPTPTAKPTKVLPTKLPTRLPTKIASPKGPVPTVGPEAPVEPEQP